MSLDKEFRKDAIYKNILFEEPKGFETSVSDFEKKASKLLNVSNALALNSATSGLHLALKVLGVEKGDLVLCSTFTFAASAFPIEYIGATPIFIDSEKDTWNMCPVLLENAIVELSKKNKKPKAIILVHSYGVPAKMSEILKISKKYKIGLIEDAAEAFGSKYKGKHCGTIGDIGVFSFNKNKVMTMFGGGLLVSDNKDHVEKAKYYATQAKENCSFYYHKELGFNYKMNPMVALYGLKKMSFFEKEIAYRTSVNEFYRESFREIKEIQFLEVTRNNVWNGWMSVLLVDSEFRKEKITNALESSGFLLRSLWNPMHLQPVFLKNKKYLNGVSDELFKKGLTLPNDLGVSLSELKKSVEVIKSNF